MILSCNSTSASICGLALSWKYNPQGLGASHREKENKLEKDIIFHPDVIGKLTNA